jgi:predicted NUDIX family NTP pyrophosphohydrolase
MPGKPKRSAGILAFRLVEGALEVLLIHPGGPFWAKKDAGSWSIPKGLYADDEDALVAAKREFEEETGLKPVGDFTALGAFRQPSGKTISA